MRVLVTGGAGFIGRHVVRELLTHDHRVTIFDCLLPEVHNDAGFPVSDVEFMRINVGYRGLLHRALKRCGKFDALIHLAASVSVADSAANPTQYFYNNSYATAVLCEALLAYPIHRLVVASSMSIYGEGPPGRLTDEGWRSRPASIYGLTKWDQERTVLLHAAANNLSGCALRLFNVYGPGQATGNKLTGVLANWAGAILKGERPRVCEDGLQSRDFIFVGDVAKAFRLAVESDADGPFNIGTGIETTVGAAATMLAAALGRPEIEPDVTGEIRFGDVRRCIADASRARQILGWKSETSFADGLSIYAAELQ